MGCDMRRREDCVEISNDRGAAMIIKRDTVQSYSSEYKSDCSSRYVLEYQ